jgi:hypothetical protein
MAKLQIKRPLARSRAVTCSGIKTSLLTGPEKRRGVRVNSRVPIALEWDAGGQVRCGEAQTRVVGPYGCLVVLPQNLEVDQRIQVTNLVSSRANPAVIVWRGHERAEGWELGIELIDPEMGFWGLDL